MADSVSSVTAALSKNQKKRARKRAKKATEGGGTDDNEGERSGEAERVREIEERIVIDPAAELKMKLEEAKANKDHETAQKLREQLWRLRDKPTDPSFTQAETQVLVQDTGVSLPSDPLDKKLSKLKKKLKQIEALQERQNSGEKLEDNQLTKISSKQELLDEIAEIEEILSLT